MGEYTPGPWRIHPTDDTLVFSDAGRVADAFPVKNNWTQAETNARLIAAAPDLMDALMAMKRAGLREGGSASEQAGLDLIYERACAAIAKATGQ